MSNALASNPSRSVLDSAEEASGLQIKSLVKAFAVLEAFRDRKRHLSLGELAVAARLDKSAVQRITHTLNKLGYLEQDPTTRRYALGNRLLDLSFNFLRSHELINRATPLLIDVRKSVGERVDFSLLDGETLQYVVRLQSKRESLVAAHVGRRVPVFCTSGGRAVLAAYDDESVMQFLSQADLRACTPRTERRPEIILEKVRQARSQGYSLQAEEWRLGEIAIGAAVTDHEGEPLGAVHIVGNLSEWTPEAFERTMAPHITALAQAIAE